MPGRSLFVRDDLSQPRPVGLAASGHRELHAIPVAAMRWKNRDLERTN